MPARRSVLDYMEDESGCWIWQLSINSTGYGLKWDREAKRLTLAHRFYYEMERGPIPDGFQVDHLCGVRVCVNPSHLEAVPHSVNHRRMLERRGIKPRGQPASRNLAQPTTVDVTQCEEWSGCRDRDGYGATWVAGRRVFAHRWAYEQAHGPIPAGLTIDHLCRNRACVNLGHLEAVTRRENNRRSALRPTCKRGHPWTAENTLWKGDDKRRCKTCHVETARRSEERRKERRKQRRRNRAEVAGRAGDSDSSAAGNAVVATAIVIV